MPSTSISPQDGSSRTDTKVIELAQAVTLVAAARGALDSGMLQALDRWQPCTADDLAVRSHLTLRSVQLTIAALSAGGVVVDQGDGYWTLRDPLQAVQAMLANDTEIRRFIETGRGPRQGDNATGDDKYAEDFALLSNLNIAEKTTLKEEAQ
jgi:hypothetical protein